MDIGAFIPIIVVLSFCSMVSWLVWLITRTRHMKIKAQLELHKRVLEKFGSAQEFADFLQTDGGKHFLDAIAAERTSPMVQILSSIQKGVVLIALGLGGLFLQWVYLSGKDFVSTTLVSALVTALGIGFVVSAGISYHLSTAWGLIGADPSQRSDSVQDRYPFS